jgi:hypothetical protein
MTSEHTIVQWISRNEKRKLLFVFLKFVLYLMIFKFTIMKSKASFGTFYHIDWNIKVIVYRWYKTVTFKIISVSGLVSPD